MTLKTGALKTIVIIVLGIANIILSSVLWFKNQPSQFSGISSNRLEIRKLNDNKLIGEGLHPRSLKPVPDDDALQNISDYRSEMGGLNSVQQGRAGVWFDTADIIKYIDTTFKNIINKMPPIDPNTEKWVVGFYWMRKNDPKDNGNLKNAFFILPSKLRLSDSLLYDYFNKKYWGKYHSNIDPATPDSGGGTAVDNGQLWP
ncbi:MAG TPA: hypothetical protein VHB48_15985 [Chitinophagaceae bacterium]|nr:hypothetical protein [Chitinophagaceae bacterium]